MLIKHEMQKIVQEQNAVEQSENIPATQGQDQASLRRGGIGEASGSRKSMSKSFSFKQEMFEQVIVPVPGPPTPRYNIDNEFRTYQRVIIDDEDELEKYAEDPMKFWTDNKSRFPLLYQVAKKYLQIPATSVPSERVFFPSRLYSQKEKDKVISKTCQSTNFPCKK